MITQIAERVPPDQVQFDLIVREFMNGVWFVWALILVGWIAIYLYERLLDARRAWEMMDRKKRPGIIRLWYYDSGVRLGVALFVVFLGDAIRAGWVWSILKLRNSFSDADTIASWWIIGLVAVALASIGALCTIRAISRRKHDWIYAALIGFGALIFAEWVLG